MVAIHFCQVIFLYSDKTIYSRGKALNEEINIKINRWAVLTFLEEEQKHELNKKG